MSDKTNDKPRFDRADGYIATGVALAVLGGILLMNEVPIGYLALAIGGCSLLIGIIARGVQVGLSLPKDKYTFDRDR